MLKESFGERSEMKNKPNIYLSDEIRENKFGDIHLAVQHPLCRMAKNAILLYFHNGKNRTTKNIFIVANHRDSL